MSAVPLGARAEHLLRDLAPQVLSVVVRRFRDFAASEDAVQEALIAAAAQWPREGVPDNPRAWLIQVAIRRNSDQVRSDAARRRREAIVVSLVPPEEQLAFAPDSDDQPESDDTLLLLFMCCHPALSASSAIALTLRAVGGLTTAEIARAFLVPEATMAQRISRAKQSIKASSVPLEVPAPSARTERLSSVLRVLYLIFNEGYTTTSGPHLQRRDLASEAIRLTRAVQAQLPDVSEVSGLLALMLLTDARRLARSGPEGQLVPLDEQDRSLWDQAAIREGVELLSQCLPRGVLGEYQLQAAIAAVHDEAESAAATDWPQILALYGVLKGLSDNPMVALSYAVAHAMVHGPASGLALLSELDADAWLGDHYRLDAVRAHLFERAGDRAAAVAYYRAAASRTTSVPERNYLMMRAARLSEGE